MREAVSEERVIAVPPSCPRTPRPSAEQAKRARTRQRGPWHREQEGVAGGGAGAGLHPSPSQPRRGPATALGPFTTSLVSVRKPLATSRRWAEQLAGAVWKLAGPRAEVGGRPPRSVTGSWPQPPPRPRLLRPLHAEPPSLCLPVLVGRCGHPEWSQRAKGPEGCRRASARGFGASAASGNEGPDAVPGSRHGEGHVCGTALKRRRPVLVPRASAVMRTQSEPERGTLAVSLQHKAHVNFSQIVIRGETRTRTHKHVPLEDASPGLSCLRGAEGAGEDGH